MLTIRLQRKGKKNQPFFKILVIEQQKSSTGGRFVEEVGFYNPLTKERSLKKDRVKYWMSVGAKPSDTVYNMLVAENIVEGKKIAKHKSPRRRPAEEARKPETPKEQPQPKAGSPLAEKEQEPTPQPTLEEPQKEDTPTS